MRIDRKRFSRELIYQNMTQKDFAQKAGISRVTINSIKNGRSCSDAIGYKIAEALGVDIVDLLEK